MSGRTEACIAPRTTPAMVQATRAPIEAASSPAKAQVKQHCGLHRTATWASESLSAAVAETEAANSATISQTPTIILGVIKQGVAPNGAGDTGIIIGEGIP